MNRVKLSEHFYRDEFACRCGCGFATADIKLIEALEDVRSHFGARFVGTWIDITGPCRCPSRNIKERGASGSKHLQGLAADFKVFYGLKSQAPRQVNPDLVATYLENKYPKTYGIGRYEDRTHLDVRPERVRWDNRLK